MMLQTCPHKCRDCPFCKCFVYGGWSIPNAFSNTDDDAEKERRARLRILQWEPIGETYKCYKPQSAECLLNQDITKERNDDKANYFLYTYFPDIWVEQHVDLYAFWGVNPDGVKEDLDNKFYAYEGLNPPNPKLWKETYIKLYKRLTGTDYNANAN